MDKRQSWASTLIRRLTRRQESLTVQAVVLTLARVVGLATTFAIPIVLVRVLAQDDFGIYKQLFLVAGTATPILSLGFGASLHYFVPRGGAEAQPYVVQALLTSVATGALAAAVLTAGAEPIADWLQSPTLARHLGLVGLYVLFASPGELVNIVPIADRRSVLAAYAIAGGEVVRAVMILGSAVVFGTVTAIVVAAAVAAFLRLLWLLGYVAFRAPERAAHPTAQAYWNQLQYSGPFAVAIVLKIGVTRFHEYYVAASVSDATFAVYALGVMNIPVFGLMVYSVGEVLLVRASVLYRDRKLAELRRLWSVALARIAVAVLPLWAILEIFAADLFRLLFGSAYVAAVPIFRVFLTASLLLIVIDHGILRATRDTLFIATAHAAGLLATAIAVVTLTRFSILVGAASGFVIGLLVTHGMGLLRVARRLEMPVRSALPWRDFGLIAVCVTVAAASASLAFLVPGGAPRLLLGGALFALPYLFLAQRFRLVPRGLVKQLVASV